MAKESLLFVVIGLLGSHVAAAQTATWLTDDQAREVVGATIRPADPRPCYSTYRDERLEDLVLSARTERLIGNRLNRSIYFYRAASDSCDFVVEKDGKTVIHSQVSMDCCEYGVVAVDRVTQKAYWFIGDKKIAAFQDLARDEKLLPDVPEPRLFFTIYSELVWGDSRKELSSFDQLHDIVQHNFRSAYILDEKDNAGQRKFEEWWRRFCAQTPSLSLETTYEKTSDGTRIGGYSFSGFELTVPPSAPPPKSTPQVFQWTILIKTDGTVEELASKTIYKSH